MKDLVIVESGMLPSEDFDVLAYGSDAVKLARKERIIKGDMIDWDGSDRCVGLGGRYAIIDRNTDDNILQDIQTKHEIESYGCRAYADNEIVSVDLFDI